jgi:peroxiredoxin
MLKAIRVRNQMRAWQKKHDALAPKVGDVAPDFELHDTGGRDSIRLSDFRGKKPVALIFGSYT